MLNKLARYDIDSDLEARGYKAGEELGVWTLFITGPNVRTWGFWCPGGRWVPWQKFTKPSAGGKSGAIGAGCGED